MSDMHVNFLEPDQDLQDKLNYAEVKFSQWTSSWAWMGVFVDLLLRITVCSDEAFRGARRNKL